VTRAVIEAGKLLDIQVIDHLIVCAASFVSFRERRLAGL